MGFVIDTSVFIRAERNRAQIDLTPWRHCGTQLLCAITGRLLETVKDA